MGEKELFGSFESKLEFAMAEANKLIKQLAAIHTEPEFGFRPESLLPSTREQLKLAFGVIVVYAKVTGQLSEEVKQECQAGYFDLSKYIPDAELDAIREYNEMIEVDASTMNEERSLQWEEKVDALERQAVDALQKAQDMKASLREEFQLLLSGEHHGPP